MIAIMMINLEQTATKNNDEDDEFRENLVLTGLKNFS